MTNLQRLLIADGAFVTPAHVLESLSAEQAKTCPNGAPHSLYEELWHSDFWQHLIPSVIRDEPVVFPNHAEESWSKDNDTLTEKVWQSLLERFSANLQRTAETAGAEDLERVAGDRTVREQLESASGHNAYHFGRMVLLWQLLGHWPPPSGGDTW